MVVFFTFCSVHLHILSSSLDRSQAHYYLSRYSVEFDAVQIFGPAGAAQVIAHLYPFLVYRSTANLIAYGTVGAIGGENVTRTRTGVLHMKLQLYLSGLVIAGLILSQVGLAHAQDPGNERWQAAYWDNVTFAGQPRLTRIEAAINYNWGAGSPAPGIIAPERFAARWTGTLSLPAGRYRFTVTVDDGVRLWVNEQLVLDKWTVQSRQVFQADVTLAGGTTAVRLAYFENTGLAEIQLAWARRNGPSAEGSPLNVWRGEYFDNVTLAGPPVLVRNDEPLNFNWGAESPAPGVMGPDRFSVRWTRTLSLNPGRYQFTATVDDGVRLWVDGRSVLDDWRVQSVRTLRAEVAVSGGAVPVRMEYFENTGVAEVHLTWTQLQGDAPAPFPPDGQTATVARTRYLNLRSGPGIGFARITLLSRGAVVDLLGRNARATWIQVRLADGTTGWVNGFYLNSATPFTVLPVIR